MQEYFSKNMKSILIAILFLAVGFFYVIQGTKSDVGWDESVLISGLPVENESFSTSQKIIVYVCGQVNNPGVYELDKGARIVDAVQMAGGFTVNAFADNINLAEFIADGQRIYVESILEETLADTRININSATKQELMSLPGIGESRAEDILAYRNSKGRFNSIEEIMEVPGIKEAAFAKIEKFIRVY